MSLALNKLGIPARSCCIVANTYRRRSQKCNDYKNCPDKIEINLRKRVAVLAGFQGISNDNRTLHLAEEDRIILLFFWHQV